jgi:ssRNA-specific RNase YbeY (16S rRNA maturation enzyme)
MKVIFSVILAIHGLIHLIGFAKGFGYGNITQLTKEITKPIGLL